MKLKYKILNEKASIEVNGNIISLKSVSIEPEVGEDRRLILSYKSGIELTIEDESVGIIILPINSHMKSMEFAGGLSIVRKGTEEVVCRFKTNTDSIPSVYEIGETFCRIVFIGEKSIELEKIETENEAI